MRDTTTTSRVRLSTWPTPLEPAPRLAAALGLRAGDLWIKRDDLTGLGGGGNKVRKLEYLCAAALANGARTLVTTGAAQSNHARLTAAAGARLGLDVVLVLAGEPPEVATGNVALDRMFGARIEWAGDVDDHRLEQVARERVSDLTERGIITELVPFGGSSLLGAYGYVDCGHELLDQAPDLARVVVAVGSGATMAGLAHVLGSERVYGVHTGAVGDPVVRVQGLVDELRSEGLPIEIHVRLDQVGDGYSTLTAPARDALRLAAHSEGIVLDPIYTARALAGLAAAVRERVILPGERIVFLHSGGLPGLFGHPVALR